MAFLEKARQDKYRWVSVVAISRVHMIHSVITPRVIIAMQMWLNLGINIKISMLGTIPMHALWRKVVLFIIKIMINRVV
jgi:hypothetical protein